MNASLAISSHNADMSQAAPVRDPQVALYLDHQSLKSTEVFAGLQAVFGRSELAAMVGIENPAVAGEIAKVFKEFSLRPELPMIELGRVTNAFAAHGGAPVSRQDYEVKSGVESTLISFGKQTKLSVIAFHGADEDGFKVSEVTLHVHGTASRAGAVGDALSLGKNWSTSYAKNMDASEAVSNAVSHERSCGGSWL